MTKLPRGLIIGAIIGVGILLWRNAKPEKSIEEQGIAHVEFVCGDDINCAEESKAALTECLAGATYDERRRPMKSGDALNRAAGINLKVLDACLLMATSHMGYANDAMLR